MRHHIKALFYLACLLLSCMSLYGCATLFADDADEISLESSTPGVTAYLNGEKLGELPLKVRVDREVFERNILVFKKDGYKTYQTMVKKTIDKIALLNCTALPSWLTDALTGNMMEYSPKHYLIEMVPQNMAASEQPHAQAQIEWKGFIALNFSQIRKELAISSSEYIQTLDYYTHQAWGRSPRWEDERVRQTLLEFSSPAAMIRYLQNHLHSSLG